MSEELTRLKMLLWISLSLFVIVFIFIMAVLYYNYPDSIPGLSELLNPNGQNGSAGASINATKMQCTDDGVGQKINVRGKAINASGYAFADYCINNTVIKFFCSTGKVLSKNYTCETSCLNGACVDLNMTCLKSDSTSKFGFNLTRAGNITGLLKNTLNTRPFYGIDHCIDNPATKTEVANSSYLMEYFCLNNRADSMSFACSGGCEKGVCKGNATAIAGCDSCLAQNKSYSCFVPSLKTSVCSANNFVTQNDIGGGGAGGGTTNPDETTTPTNACSILGQKRCGLVTVDGFVSQTSTSFQVCLNYTGNSNFPGKSGLWWGGFVIANSCGYGQCTGNGDCIADSSVLCGAESGLKLVTSCNNPSINQDAVCHGALISATTLTDYNSCASYCGDKGAGCYLQSISGSPNCKCYSGLNINAKCSGEQVAFTNLADTNTCSDYCTKSGASCFAYGANSGISSVNCVCYSGSATSSSNWAGGVCRGANCVSSSSITGNAISNTESEFGKGITGFAVSEGNVTDYSNAICQSCRAKCGDGICSENENYIKCPGDCKLKTCGDDRCQSELGETTTSCPYDCSATCGNGWCDGLEPFLGNCRQDCGSRCGTSADCNSGSMCIAGACIPDSLCQKQSDCISQARCVAGVCRPTCQTDGECPQGEECKQGVCLRISLNKFPRIDSITPNSGKPGDSLTIRGEGFSTTEDNLVLFKITSSPITFYNAKAGIDYRIVNLVSSADGKTIRITIPNQIYVLDSTYGEPKISMPAVPGNYEITIVNTTVDYKSKGIAGIIKSNGVKLKINGDLDVYKITFSSPKSGDIWTVGEANVINWNIISTLSKINLYVSTKNYRFDNTHVGSYFQKLALNISNGGRYSWVVNLSDKNLNLDSTTNLPNIPGDGKFDSYVIIEGKDNKEILFKDSSDIFTISDSSKARVCTNTNLVNCFGNEVCAEGFCADNSGGISISYPNGGETLSKGSPYTLRWNSPSTIRNVDVVLKKDSGTETSLVGGYVNTNSYVWTVPSGTSVPAGSYKLKIINSANPNAYGESTGWFTIGAENTTVIIGGVCIAGTKACVGSGYRLCENINGSWRWGANVTTCPSGNICSAGTCVNIKGTVCGNGKCEDGEGDVFDTTNPFATVYAKINGTCTRDCTPNGQGPCFWAWKNLAVSCDNQLCDSGPCTNGQDFGLYGAQYGGYCDGMANGEPTNYKCYAINLDGSYSYIAEGVLQSKPPTFPVSTSEGGNYVPGEWRWVQQGCGDPSRPWNCHTVWANPSITCTQKSQDLINSGMGQGTIEVGYGLNYPGNPPVCVNEFVPGWTDWITKLYENPYLKSVDFLNADSAASAFLRGTAWVNKPGYTQSCGNWGGANNFCKCYELNADGSLGYDLGAGSLEVNGNCGTLYSTTGWQPNLGHSACYYLGIHPEEPAGPEYYNPNRGVYSSTRVGTREVSYPSNCYREYKPAT